MNILATFLIVICLAGWWAAMVFDVVTEEYDVGAITEPLFMRVYGVAFIIACAGLLKLML